MNLDQLLTDALHDDRLALAVPADTLEVVRRMRRTRRALGVAGASLSVVAVVTAAVALAPSGGRRSAIVGSTPPTTPVASSPTPIPGSTPAYYTHTGRDWFMTAAQFDAFSHGYVEPSSQPDDLVPSPQTSGPQTDRLAEAMTAAGVPGVDQLSRDEAEAGLRDTYNVQGSLPDGGKISVSRRQATYPSMIQRRSSDTEPVPPAPPVVDVPGTTDAAVTLTSGTLTFIEIADANGVITDWSADVPLSELRTWAFAADRWLAEHPA